MALLNPTFADAGALPGEAARWTISAVTSLEVLAAFGGAGREDFEPWSAFLAALADVTVVRAFFGRDGFEAFERPYLFALPTGRVVACSFGVRDVETQFYPGGRHEMFNETNRDEVIANLIAWLNRITSA